MNVSRSSATHKNRAELAGVLAADPVIRTTSGGRKVANFSVTTNEKGGRTERHRVVAWQDLADQVEGLREGAFIELLGRLQTRSWDDSGVKKYITEIVAWQIAIAEKEATVKNPHGVEVSDEDLPF